MAMLTNPFETQLVQSLGVRIGPDRAEASAKAGPVSSMDSPAGTKCPFGAMIPATDGRGARPLDSAQGGPGEAGSPMPVRWTTAAEARLANIPAFVRPMARTGIERFARERGVSEVDEKILDEARDFFGM